MVLTQYYNYMLWGALALLLYLLNYCAVYSVPALIKKRWRAGTLFAYLFPPYSLIYFVKIHFYMEDILSAISPYISEEILENPHPEIVHAHLLNLTVEKMVKG